MKARRPRLAPCIHEKATGKFCIICKHKVKVQRAPKREIQEVRWKNPSLPPHCSHIKVKGRRFCEACNKKRIAKRKHSYWHSYWLKHRETIRKFNRERYYWIKQNDSKSYERQLERARQRYWDNKNPFSKLPLCEVSVRKMAHAKVSRCLGLRREQQRQTPAKQKDAA